MLACAAKKGPESACCLSDLRAAVNPAAPSVTAEESANEVSRSALALVVQGHALKSVVKVKTENPWYEAWQKLKDEFEPSQESAGEQHHCGSMQTRTTIIRPRLDSSSIPPRPNYVPSLLLSKSAIALASLDREVDWLWGGEPKAVCDIITW
jgi:hypothetical protein